MSCIHTTTETHGTVLINAAPVTSLCPVLMKKTLLAYNIISESLTCCVHVVQIDEVNINLR